MEAASESPGADPERAEAILPFPSHSIALKRLPTMYLQPPSARPLLIGRPSASYWSWSIRDELPRE